MSAESLIDRIFDDLRKLRLRVGEVEHRTDASGLCGATLSILLRSLLLLLELRGRGMNHRGRHDSLKLLFSEQIFPVGVLLPQLRIGALNAGLLLSQLTNQLFKLIYLLTPLLTASLRTFTVLKAFSRFLILIGVILVVELAAFVADCLLDVLSLLLR